MCFEWMHEKLEAAKPFNAVMGTIRSTRKFWASWFLVEEELVSGFSGGDEDVLLVDVGGGNGHDLEALLELFPQAKEYLTS